MRRIKPIDEIFDAVFDRFFSRSPKPEIQTVRVSLGKKAMHRLMLGETVSFTTPEAQIDVTFTGK